MSKNKKTLDELLDSALVSDEEQPYEIPEGWIWVRLGEIVSINPTKPKLTYDDDVVCSFLPMTMVDERFGSIIQLEERPFSKVKKGYTYFEKDDILFAKITPCMENGNTVIAEGLLNGFGFGSTEFYVIRPSKAVLNKYMYYLLRSQKFRSQAKQVMTGAVGQQRVPKSFLEDYSFALPPIKQQKEIVNKIEILFAKLDESKQFIDEAKETFGFRRAAIFKEIYGDPNKIEDKYWKTIGELFYVQVGSTPSRKVDAYWNGENPWLSSGEVNFNRVIDSKEKVTDLAIKEARLKLAPKGSILFGMIGEGKTRGQVAILDIDSYHNQNMASIWVSETNIPTEYVYYWLVSKYTENRQNSSGNNQPAYNKARVQALTIPIYEESVMQKKVEILSKLEELESRVNDLIDLEQNISNIKQSILLKAFKGELGKNEPTDEQAMELLKSVLQEKL